MNAVVKRGARLESQTYSPGTQEEYVQPNSHADGDTWCSRVAKFARVSNRSWDGTRLRFNVAIWTADPSTQTLCNLRVSLRIASIGCNFRDIQVREVDLSRLPVVYGVSAKWDALKGRDAPSGEKAVRT